MRWGVANLSNVRPVCACCANCVAALFGGVLFMFTPALTYSCSDVGFGPGDGLIALCVGPLLFSHHVTHMCECGHSRACQLYSTSFQLPSCWRGGVTSPEPSVYSLFRPLHFRQQWQGRCWQHYVPVVADSPYFCTVELFSRPRLCVRVCISLGRVCGCSPFGCICRSGDSFAAACEHTA